MRPVIGFTGTQKGMTVPQRMSVDYILRGLQRSETPEIEFWHGACVGADAEAAMVARKRGYFVVAFPGSDPARRTQFESDVEHEPADFLERNMVIARNCGVLIAAPKGEHEQQRGSGTWATVRYARAAGKTVYLCYPSGRVDLELPEAKPGSLIERRTVPNINPTKVKGTR